MIQRSLMAVLILLTASSVGLAGQRVKGAPVSYKQVMRGLDGYFPQMQEVASRERSFGKTKDGFVMFSIGGARAAVEYIQLYAYTREPANTPRIIKRSDEIRRIILSNIFADQGEDAFSWSTSAIGEIASSAEEGRSRQKEIAGKTLVISVENTGFVVLTVALR